MKLLSFYCCCALVIASAASVAESPPTPISTAFSPSDGQVWQLRGDAGTWWLLGDLHFGRDPQAPWPAAVAYALTRCDVLAVEGAVSDDSATAIAELTREQGLSRQPLFSRLTPATRQRLREWLQYRGHPEALFARQQPWLAASSLLSLERQRLGYLDSGSLTQRLLTAFAHQRRVVSLSSPQDQIQRLAALPLDDQQALLAHALDLLPYLAAHLDSVQQAWTRGDAQHVARLLNRSIADQPTLKTALLDAPQQQVTAKTTALLAQKTTPCVVVGAAQIAGLIATWQQAGYIATPAVPEVTP